MTFNLTKMNLNKNIVTEDRANLITKSESSVSQIDILKAENKQLISNIEKLEISNRHIIKLNEELTEENTRIIEKLESQKPNNIYADGDFAAAVEFNAGKENKEVENFLKRPNPSPTTSRNDGYGDTQFKANILLYLGLFTIFLSFFVFVYWIYTAINII